MWNDRGHLNIYLDNDTVIYKEAAQPSNIGVIIISDTMGKCQRYVKEKQRNHLFRIGTAWLTTINGALR